MSHLLFMDESGHHGGDGFEVRGGIVLPANRVWRFTREMRGLEGRCFGDILQNHGKELKSVKLLERKRIRLTNQHAQIPEDERQRLCREYFGQARNGMSPTLLHNIAYAQAGVLFVDELLKLIKRHKGRIFATVVPSKHSKPPKEIERNFVRRDMKYLMGALYHYCEEQSSDGILVLDETDRTDDRRFLQRLERYFSTTESGRTHGGLVLPTPLFTESTMSYPVQAADVVCYLISHGFRLPGMGEPSRQDLKSEWLTAVEQLRFSCVRTVRNSGPKRHYSIVYVAQPWQGAKKREGKTLLQNDPKGGFRGRASVQHYTSERAGNEGIAWRKPQK